MRASLPNVSIKGAALAACCLLSIVPPAVADEGANGEARELQFRVLLDDKEIGFHRYRLHEDGSTIQVQSEAKFDVKFLFFNAYSYRHSLSASWRGECLNDLEARTNDNGKRIEVTGARDDNEFVVETGGEVDELPVCVKDFAYWDKRILEENRLLNPQTGEYLEVSVEPLGEEQVLAGGASVAAQAYRITAKGMRIDVWYGKENDQWLKLESLAKGDRVIRYELT